MNFSDALGWLYATQLHGVKLGLDNMRRLAAELRLDLSGAGVRFLHVAGTNGKGSTCAMLDSILRASGRRTGLFTSPHLITFRERIAVDGAWISEPDVAEGLTRIREIIESWDPSPTFFEITTALALLYFQQQGVECAVLETGLGGRLDATNIVTPCIAVLTPIDLDHQQWLGHTLPEIAVEKAGIIKPGVPAISAPQRGEVLELLGQVAAERGSSFHFVISPLEGVPLALAGDYQRWNAALAVHALDAGGIPVDNSALVRGLATVRWPGRFQRLDGEAIVLDGAHNGPAARQLTKTWAEIFGAEEATIIIGVMRDKDVAGICAALAPLARRFLAVPVQSPRAIPPAEIVSALQTVAPAIEAHAVGSLEEAVQSAFEHTERILITGSLFLVGEALSLLRGDGDWEPSLQ